MDVSSNKTDESPSSQHVAIPPINISDPMPESEGSLVRGRVQVSTTSIHTGPLPPAEMLADYDAILPGAADRILTMAEKQQNHRQAMESKVLDSHIERSSHGLYAGLVVALVGLGVSAYGLFLGYPWASTVLAGGILLSLVSVFVYGKKHRDDELEEKKKPTTPPTKKRGSTKKQVSDEPQSPASMETPTAT